MEKLAVVIVMGLFGFILQPPIGEVGISGGPHWPDPNTREPLRRMATRVTAHTALNEYFGVEFGGGYKQGGYSHCVARPRQETTLPAKRQASIRATPPCVWPHMMETHEAETVRRLYDYIDFSMFGQARIPAGGRLDVRLVIGPTWGIPVKCRRKSVSHGGVRDCSTANLGTDRRLVIGAGAGFQVSPSLDVSLDYRRGTDMREQPSGGIDFTSSLIAGISYRLTR